MKDRIISYLEEVLPKGVEPNITVPENADFGHYSTNIAFELAKKSGKSPVSVAEEVAKKAGESGLFARVEAARGFVNFWLKDEAFFDELKSVLNSGEKYGRNNFFKKQKTIVEYTDPNPFKEIHIGHLMSNSIGEAISRLIEWSGAEVKRACYQGDVGLHVAKAIWGMIRAAEKPAKGTLHEKIRYMADAYVSGATAYESGEAKDEIQKINKQVYERSDKKVNELYDWGREVSLEYFETIYKKLGTKFDYYFFESESAGVGKEVVEDGLKKGIFEKSDGAVVFKGESKGLHTRVFINSEGLPTYEAKDLGLAGIKHKKYAYDKSVIITGNEVKDYFRVVLAAMAEISPDLAEKTTHLSHGMMRFAGGKMSSRTGKVITFDSILEGVRKLVAEKMKESVLSDREKNDIGEQVAVGALKYSILKQSIGGDIIFDFEKSISFEGDSGPYLQYAYVRAKSVLEKAKKEGVQPSLKKLPGEVSELEPKICRFPEVVGRAAKEYAPSQVAGYLIDLARTYNSYYAQFKIVDAKEEESPYRVALTKSFAQVMKNGLEVLGMPIPEKM